MTQKKLFKMLSLCAEVISRRWRVVMEVVAEIKEGNAVVLEKEWYDEHKNENLDLYPLDLSDISVWSTYDQKCIDLSFRINKDNKLICDAIIYDGKMLDGRRTDQRFTAKILLPNNFIKKIEEYIKHGFEEFLEDQYQNHLELQKLEWKTNLRKSILND